MKWGAETLSWKQIDVGAIKSKWQVKVIKEKAMTGKSYKGEGNDR